MQCLKAFLCQAVQWGQLHAAWRLVKSENAVRVQNKDRVVAVGWCGPYLVDVRLASWG